MYAFVMASVLLFFCPTPILSDAKLDFFSTIFDQNNNTEYKHIHLNTILIPHLFRYENQEIALNCGMILRECLRHEVLTKIVFNSNQVYKFFDYVEMNTFDIASDAFATFKVRVHPFSDIYQSGNGPTRI